MLKDLTNHRQQVPVMITPNAANEAKNEDNPFDIQLTPSTLATSAWWRHKGARVKRYDRHPISRTVPLEWIMEGHLQSAR
jgi:hypothetical protein